MTTPDAPREITVERIEEIRRMWHGGLFGNPTEQEVDALCAAARRALSQEGGEPRCPDCGCEFDDHQCPSVSVEREREDDFMRDYLSETLADTPQSVPAEQELTCSACGTFHGDELGACPMDDCPTPLPPDAPLSQGEELVKRLRNRTGFARNLTDEAADFIASLIAERDATAASVDRWMQHYKDLEAERDKLKGWNKELAAVANANIERVSVLEKALKAYVNFDSAADRINGLDECDRHARAALTRTSEGA